MDQTRVAIVGATGYTGAELLRLLLGHRHVEVTLLSAREKLVPRVGDALPHLRGVCALPVEPFDPDRVAAAADVAFCALPHGASAGCVRALRQRGVTVLDLSADLRLRDPEEHRRWYGHDEAPELRSEAVYGLPELHREALRQAKLVAVPGCYPTASALPLLPLLHGALVRTDDVVVHALSGVSGAGRSPSASTHFSETAEGVRPYKVAGVHRHTPELEQILSFVAGARVMVTFTPTLVPMTRGILATVYLRPTGEVTAEALVASARRYYEASPSVVVLDPGALPDTLWVRGTNRALVSYAVDARSGRVLAFGALDNLVKGAAGQAVQCMNLLRGYDEAEGLGGAALFP
ncbi:MAG: N-acetyl-gamma-glutamyl-phosphate reductase [Deltaproteobacteria bacterium]|nr:N-acetyl-gamma-glutamyl-phosphate reductase [Deltaproteobacteria bacterium]